MPKIKKKAVVKKKKKEVRVHFDFLEKLIDEALVKKWEAKKRERKISVRFAASNAGYCPRAAVLNRLRADEKPLEPKSLRVFWIGQMLHDAVEDIARESGRLIASEKWIERDEIVHGKYDFILQEDDGDNTLYELKSINTSAFWWMILKSKEAKKHNIYQAITYWYLIKGYRFSRLKIAYLSKEDASLKVFTINVTKKLIKEVQSWWKKLDKQYWNRTLPATFEKKDKEYKSWCHYCTFKNIYCFNKDKEEMEDNIQRLVWPDAKEKPSKAAKRKGIEITTVEA